MTGIKPACEIEGCERPVKARKLCNAHYLQQRKGTGIKPARARRTKAEPCSVDRCDSPARYYKSGQSLCSKHHERWKRYGDPTFAPKLAVVPRGLAAIADAVATRDRSACWLDWSELPCWADLGSWGGSYRAGYPMLGNDRVMHLAMQADGRPKPPAPGNHGLHSCDVPACWNPGHLRWGTVVENLMDRAGKLNYCAHCPHCNA